MLRKRVPHLRLASSAPQGEREEEPVLEEELLTFDDMFRRWAPYVGGIATRMMGPNGDVDDLVQNVFVDAFNGFDRLREPAAVKAWLTTITVRRVRRHLARKRRRRFFGLDTGKEPVAPHVSPDQQAQLEEAYRALERVRPEERIAWVLRTVEGHTLPEVARLSGCSRATAHRRIQTVTRMFAKEFSHGE